MAESVAMWLCGPACVAFLVIQVPNVPLAWDAAHGRGIAGTFTAESKSKYTKSPDTWHGTVVSHDRATERTRLDYRGGGLKKPGDQVDVLIEPGDDDTAYEAGSYREFWWLFPYCVLAGLLLTGWLLMLWVRWAPAGLVKTGRHEAR